jgi:hypothetical protein
MCLACLVLPTRSDDGFSIPCLHGTFPPQPSAHAASPLPANSDDKVLIPRFSLHAALVLCDGDAAVSLPRLGVSYLSTSPSSPIDRPQRTLHASSRGRCPLGCSKFRFASSSQATHIMFPSSGMAAVDFWLARFILDKNVRPRAVSYGYQMSSYWLLSK